MYRWDNESHSMTSLVPMTSARTPLLAHPNTDTQTSTQYGDWTMRVQMKTATQLPSFTTHGTCLCYLRKSQHSLIHDGDTDLWSWDDLPRSGVYDELDALRQRQLQQLARTKGPVERRLMRMRQTRRGLFRSAPSRSVDKEESKGDYGSMFEDGDENLALIQW